MTQTVRFVDTVSYTEADQADFNMRMMRPQGVIPESSLGTLTPSAIASMNVRVGPGEAFIQGFQYKNDANVDLAIGANASGSTRIDIVVLSLNRTANTLVLAIKIGTPGAGAPALVQTVGGNWEFPVCQVSVANGAVSIVIGNITDSRVYSKWPTTALEDTVVTDSDATTFARVKVKGVLNTAGGILASVGVASIDLATGYRKINFTTPYANTNYVVGCIANRLGGLVIPVQINIRDKATTYVAFDIFDNTTNTSVEAPIEFFVLDI